jgi:hypothetical protein
MEMVTHATTGRVILANEPRLLRELIAYTFDRFWGKGVAVTSSTHIEEILGRQQSQWLVLTLEAQSEFAKTYWLETFPSLNVVRLSRDGRSAIIRWSNGTEETVDNITLQEFVKLLES